MPEPFERYNRFMKYLAPGWSNDKKLDTGSGWNKCDWTTSCEVCDKIEKRSNLKLKGGLLRCEDCLKNYERV
jgi:hypothetical protein